MGQSLSPVRRGALADRLPLNDELLGTQLVLGIFPFLLSLPEVVSIMVQTVQAARKC